MFQQSLSDHSCFQRDQSTILFYTVYELYVLVRLDLFTAIYNKDDSKALFECILD